MLSTLSSPMKRGDSVLKDTAEYLEGMPPFQQLVVH